MSSTASAAAIRRDVAELIRPPRRIRASQAAAEVMKVVGGDGTVRDWSPEATPYMVEPLDCMGSRRYDAVIFVGPARTGKTNALVDGYVAYKIDCDPGDGLIIQISEDKAREFSKKRIDRMLQNSPRLIPRLSPRGHDNNVHDKTFRAGNYLGIKWPSKNVMASSDYQFVLITDFDRLGDDIDGEGDPFTLASKRTQTFGSTGMTLAESSPGREITDPDWERPADQPHMAPPTTGILDWYNHGDRRRLYWQCPESSCRRWFQPIKEHFNQASKRVCCSHCGAEVDPKLKRALNLAGRWVPEGCELTVEGELVGTPRQTRIASFWMEGPAAAFQSWTSLAEKLARAEETYALTGSQETLKTVINTDWGRPYKHRRSDVQRSSQRLMDRAEQVERRTVPLGVRFLTATVDVQGGKDRRFVVQVHGTGVNREKWIVDRFNIREDKGPNNDQEPRQISPATQPEDWDLLTRDVLKRSYRLSDGSGRRMPILAVAVDTGGEGEGEESVTSQAYEWFRRLRTDGLQGRAYLLKGGSSKTTNRVRKTWPDNTSRKSRKSRARGDVPLYILGTDLLKDAVAAMMDRDNPGAGYMHVPAWLGRWWYDELTYEVRDPATGKWSKPGKKANEAFDLCAYDLALGIILGVEKINWAAPPPWADEWERNLLVFDPDSDARPEEPKYKQPAAAKKRRRKVAKPRI
ncbi:phage terminase large subunit family protein [Billgrantia bachuensis]|uniref:Phage terminase large subunit family protein n=1 Tax=Billgrantia bachuensis TaxID=2717286 RepID=A0ABX0PPQ0_9GAMM|nr:terminase gpA endonuclease subunit [Halomonas bachuensis]NIC05255.1 phage terminase large subunit family protein [Halomonas bachuensis]